MTISLRLSIWLSAAFLAGFVIFGAAVWLDLSYSLSQGRTRTITGRSRRLEELLDKSGPDTPQRRAAKFDDFAQATPEGNLIQVFDGNGVRVYPASPSQATSFPWPEATGAPGPQISELNFLGRRYRVIARVVEFDGKLLRLLVAGQLEDNRLLLQRFRTSLLWTIPVSIGLSSILGYFLSRRALRPVVRLTALARSITIGNLSRRLPVSKSGDELQQLAQTCNEMLGRLEEAVNQITRFTADASHELRSPLSLIRTTAECALQNPYVDTESAESLREIVDETEQASRLLDDMLTLARSDAGHAETVFETVDLAWVINEVSGKIRAFAEAKGHELSVQLAAHRPILITGDASSLRRLIWILLDNAIKYTPAGGDIEVRLDAVENEALVSVRDSGVGIPSAVLPHIFDRFYRVDASRGSDEGTGLGLSIAKWIADVHHAVMSVESAEKAGTSFRVRFRLADF